MADNKIVGFHPVAFKQMMTNLKAHNLKIWKNI